MEADGTLPYLEGTLSALSHTFMLRQDIFYLIELCCQNSIRHIMVRHPSQQEMRSDLQINSRYRITDVLPQALYKGSMPILVARRTTKITKLQDQVDNDDLLDLSINNTLISFKGTVTAVVDQELGLFELDQKIYLVTSFLNDITGEIWTEGDRSSAKVETILNRYLNVGDAISLYHVHLSKMEGLTYLTCCGRSLLVNNNRSLHVRRSIKRSSNALLDILHTYNFGLVSLTWLRKMKQQLVEVLCPKYVAESHIARRPSDGESTFLFRLMEEAVDRNLITLRSRSLVKEFLHHDSHCFTCKKSGSPFSFVKIGDLKSESIFVKAESAEEPSIVFWKYNISERNPHRLVAGKLCLGQNGTLQLHDVNEYINILIIGSKNTMLIGCLVALLNFIVVEEEFNILYNGTYIRKVKKYLLVDIADLIILLKGDYYKQPQQVSYKHTMLTVVSLSNLMCSEQQQSIDDQRVSGEKSFFAKVLFSQTDSKGKMDKWDSFVRFSGSAASVYPFLETGSTYTVDTGLKNPVVELKKKVTNSCLLSMSGYFNSYECTYLPESTTVIGVVSGHPHHLVSLDVKSVLDAEYENNGPISVVGIVKDRQLMTPKFQSENLGSPLQNCQDHHIGVPGSKILRVLLSDCLENTNSSVWLYFTGTSRQYDLMYPYGILPGTKLTVSCLLRKVSRKTNSVYLQSTIFTQFLPLSFPNLKTLSLCKPSHQYLKNISNQKGLFQVIAHIESIQRVILSCVCQSCKLETVNGTCSYVGCNSLGGGKLNIHSQVLIDDGTGLALVILNTPKHLQTLLQLTDEEYVPLSKCVIESSYKLSYHYSQAYTETLKLNGSDRAFAKLCSRNELCRPMKFECRVFQEQSEEIPLLYCVHVFEMDPEDDVKIWQTKLECTS